ncbi:MAG: GDP-mannose 4,6-dehydratase [Vicinamibacterales bacterium]
MSWAQRRVYVTGSTGIVGSWLVKRLLHEGAFVVALVRDADPQSELLRSGDLRRVSVVNGCLEDYATQERAINEHEIDTVFHLAAQPIVSTALRNPLPTFEANIRGTWHVLEAARVHAKLVKRVIVASSDKAYGDSLVLPYTEDMPVNGKHPYDVSKSCTDLLAVSYAHTYGLPVVIARCGNIYGGGDLNWSRLIPGTIRSLLLGERPIIRSDGKYLRDYIYVEDVVEAYLALGELAGDPEARGQAFNFSPEQALSVVDVVTHLQRAMSRPDLTPVILDAVTAEIRDQFLDSSKARRMLGWSSRFTIEEGLERTVRWYEAFLAQPEPAA